jgi:cell cycle sensor histidine kinase DivJ
VPADLPEIVADKRAVKQILLNLLSNAIKFTDRGGKVVASAKVELGHIVLTVEDTGIGISDSDLPQIGTPFFQARSAYDRRHDGTGLGLSIVRGLVALHGGRFDIVSILGKGTKVTVTLPANCELPARLRKPEETRPARVNQLQPRTEGQVRKSA